MNVKNMGVVLVAIAMLFIVGCSSSTTSITGTPFIGGSEGLQLSFLEGAPPSEIFDDGQYPFSVAVQIRNNGEDDIDVNDGYVELIGILPEVYGVSASDLTQDLPEIEGARKSATSVIDGSIEIISFDGLNYQQDIQGLTQNLRATACYNYVTKTTTNICVKEDSFNSLEKDEVCTITETKPVANSAGPIQILSMQQTVAGSESVQVVFTVGHVGLESDHFFKVGADCDARDGNPDLYKVFIDVDSIVNNGISAECSGFQEGSGSSGYITLFDKQPRTVTCKFDLSSIRGSSETPLNIDLEYRYMQSIEKQIEVRDVSTNQ
jgi:hypothetical protein